MALDTDKIDDAVLALLFLTLHDHWRAWKGVDWDALNRLYEKGPDRRPGQQGQVRRVHRGGLEARRRTLPRYVHQTGLIPFGRPVALSETAQGAASGRCDGCA